MHGGGVMMVRGCVGCDNEKKGVFCDNYCYSLVSLSLVAGVFFDAKGERRIVFWPTHEPTKIRKKTTSI